MTEFETMILVFLVLVTVAGYVYYKLHQAEKRIDALLKQEKERLIEEQRLARIKHRESRLAEFKATTPPKVSSGFVQSNRPTSKTATSSYISSSTPSAPTPVVVHNDTDLLSTMMLYNALSSHSESTVKPHYSNTDNPVDFPAATPEPSYSSSSSSSSDDSASRSSYSSSYSGSNSDSSYSSSSSDSSYSSSSSDSSDNSN